MGDHESAPDVNQGTDVVEELTNRGLEFMYYNPAWRENLKHNISF
jgi:hypothetical protein